MKKVTIVFGNITFKGKKCIVHEIYGIFKCSEENAADFGEDNINIMESFVIPEFFSGEIIYECETTISI